MNRTHHSTAAALVLLAPLAAGAATYDLSVDRVRIDTGDFVRDGVGYNGTSPGPVLRFREGEEAVIHVTNNLPESTSVHWHGLIVPPEMDGVPTISFDGIAPGETFTYRFPVVQAGTYWFHSHSNMQEPDGAYGAIVIEPREPDPVAYDREHVIVITDAHPHHAHRILRNLKRMPDYYNRHQETLLDYLDDIGERGAAAATADRMAWGDMRMMRTDIEDVQGFTALVNGRGPAQNWTGLFRPGERVRLRIVNASAMTYFDLRIPGAMLEVVQADGNDVRPVLVDELRIAVAETYDVVVHLTEDRAYTLFAESMGRSGHARATLAPREGMVGEVPAMRSPPLLTMADMGMAHGDHAGHAMPMAGGQAMDHAAMGHGMPGSEPAATSATTGMDHAAMGHGTAAPVDHAAMGHAMPGPEPAATGAMTGMDHAAMGHGTAAPVDHAAMGHAMPGPEPAATGAMTGMDHAAMGHGTAAPVDHAAMGHAMPGPEPAATGATTGMDHAAMSHGTAAPVDHAAMGHAMPGSEPAATGAMTGMDHAAMGHGTAAPGDHAAMGHAMPGSEPAATSAMTGMDHSAMGHGTAAPVDHGAMGHGATGGGDPFYAPGSGLAPSAANGGRFLSYADLRALKPLYPHREATREIELRLTGNMERYVWTINGVKYEDAEPIRLTYGERVRFRFVNETMMTHPMHLHGMWSILDVGAGQWNPVKHVVSVAPGTTVNMETEVDAPGEWAFHCHLAYHAHSGMFRKVVVEGGPQTTQAAPAPEVGG